MNLSPPQRTSNRLSSARLSNAIAIATPADIEEAIGFVKNATVDKLNIEVSDEKVRRVAKIYLKQKGMIVQNEDLEESSSESSGEKSPGGQDAHGRRPNDKRRRTDWAERIRHFRQYKEQHQSKVNEIEEHKQSFKKRGMLPDIGSFKSRSKSQANVVAFKAPEIFSAENYERIVQDQRKATLQAKPKLLAKL